MEIKKYSKQIISVLIIVGVLGSDKNTDGSTAGLNQYGHNHTDTDTQQRIAGENLDEMYEAGIVTQRHNSLAHHIHAQHQNTEAQHNLPKIFCAAFSCQQLHQKADED